MRKSLKSSISGPDHRDVLAENQDRELPADKRARLFYTKSLRYGIQRQSCGPALNV